MVSDGSDIFEKLHIKIARLSNSLSTQGNVGLVVGALESAQLADIREVCPSLPILIPGIGTQGGDLKNAVLNGVNFNRELAIINSSRGIIYASSGVDFAIKARIETLKLRDDINQILLER